MATTTRRALRSNTTLNDTLSAESAAIMAPSKKRKAAEMEKFSCFTCAADKPPQQFPDYNPSPDCDHFINTCKTCLRQWIESCIEEANFKTGISGGDEGEDDGDAKDVWGIACPQCEGVMRAVNVQMAVPKRVLKRWAS